MKILAKTSSPSSGRSADSLRVLPKRDYILSVHHEGATDEFFFQRVEALHVTHYRACTSEMIAAYDRVTDMGDTTWLAEVRQQLQSAREPVEDLQHLRLYLDDGPCYEFICHDFRAETKASA